MTLKQTRSAIMFLADCNQNKIRYLILICLIVLYPISGFADTDFISPEYTAMQMKKKNYKYQIIDIRQAREFKKIHILGSINIPLHFIKSKRYLKQKTIIIAGKGFFYRQIKQECKKLKKQNFNVKILNGGLNTWLTKNLPVKGSLFSQEDFYLTDPRKVYQEQNIHPLLFVDSSEKQIQSKGPKVIFADTISINLKSDQSFKEITKFNKTKPNGSILVFNNFGENYNTIRNQMLAKNINNLFFLKGGLNAYKKYLHNLELAKAPRQQRLKTMQKCRDCGDKDKEI
jgi:rhodanese-related sulfurtransferase